MTLPPIENNCIKTVMHSRQLHRLKEAMAMNQTEDGEFAKILLYLFFHPAQVFANELLCELTLETICIGNECKKNASFIARPLSNQTDTFIFPKQFFFFIFEGFYNIELCTMRTLVLCRVKIEWPIRVERVIYCILIIINPFIQSGSCILIA